jgi:hypothetical protein
MQLALLYRPPQWFTGPNQVGLTDVVCQLRWPHARGQRAKSAAAGKQAILH